MAETGFYGRNQLAGPLDLAQGVVGYQNALRKGRADEFALQQGMDEASRQQAIRNRLRSAADPQAAERVLLEEGDIKGYGTVVHQRRLTEKAAADAKAAELDAQVKKLGIIGQALGSVRDQKTWDMALSGLQQMGLNPPPDAPPQYDPAYVDFHRNKALTALQQVEQARQQRGQQVTEANQPIAVGPGGVPQRNELAIGAKSEIAQAGAATQPIPMISAIGPDGKPTLLIPPTRAGGKPRPTEFQPVPRSQGRPLPPAVLKQQNDLLEDMQIASAISSDIGAVAAQLDSGQIKLGPVANIQSRGLNIAGRSTEQSRNFASFKATLEKLRNDSLRLNKGVQTEGDSVRAWNELFETINDPKQVSQRLGEIQKLNERAASQKAALIDATRQQYDLEPMDYSKFTKQPAAVGGTSGGMSIDDRLKKYQ